MIHDTPIAQLRFDLHDVFWEISYSVDAAFRNRGIGEILLRKGMLRLLQKLQTDCKIVGHVKPANIASAEVFKKLHFTQQTNEIKDGIELLRFEYSLQSQLLSLQRNQFHNL
jgi:RimJ/RimL family protein N-acetyltransferase